MGSFKRCTNVLGPYIQSLDSITIKDLSSVNSVYMSFSNMTFYPLDKVSYIDVIVQSGTNCSKFLCLNLIKYFLKQFFFN